jgi:hypothetical protein
VVALSGSSSGQFVGERQTKSATLAREFCAEKSAFSPLFFERKIKKNTFFEKQS